jgi:hypothetical protein
MLKTAHSTTVNSERPVLTYAAFDWLSTAAGNMPLTTPDDIKIIIERGMQRLRTVLSDAATHYMDVTPTTRARELMRLTMSTATARLVKGALTLQVVVNFFDSTRLGAGLRLANYAFGPVMVPLGNALNSSEQGRTDAYMAMRLYKALEIVVALMMMGVAKEAEEEGKQLAHPRPVHTLLHTNTHIDTNVARCRQP